MINLLAPARDKLKCRQNSFASEENLGLSRSTTAYFRITAEPV